MRSNPIAHGIVKCQRMGVSGLVRVRQGPGEGLGAQESGSRDEGWGEGLPGQTAELLQGLCSRNGPLHWVL